MSATGYQQDREAYRQWLYSDGGDRERGYVIAMLRKNSWAGMVRICKIGGAG